METEACKHPHRTLANISLSISEWMAWCTQAAQIFIHAERSGRSSAFPQRQLNYLMSVTPHHEKWHALTEERRRVLATCTIDSIIAFLKQNQRS